MADAARRWQLLPARSCCADPWCAVPIAATQEAAAQHAATTGHQTRHILAQQVIYTVRETAGVSGNG
jgi:hypothetical protein